MDVTPELVERMAELACLELNPEEAGEAAAQMERIVACMEVLGRLDAGGVEPAAPVRNVLREDEVRPSWDRAELLACSPGSDGEYFLVPKAVE